MSGPSPAVAEELRAATSAYEAWGARVAMNQTRAELAEVLDDLGHGDEAASLRATVREFYEGLGARRWLTELDAVSTRA